MPGRSAVCRLQSTTIFLLYTAAAGRRDGCLRRPHFCMTSAGASRMFPITKPVWHSSPGTAAQTASPALLRPFQTGPQNGTSACRHYPDRRRAGPFPLQCCPVGSCETFGRDPCYLLYRVRQRIAGAADSCKKSGYADEGVFCGHPDLLGEVPVTGPYRFQNPGFFCAS